MKFPNPTSFTIKWWVWLLVWIACYFGYLIYAQIGWFFRQSVHPEQSGFFVDSSFIWHTVLVFLGSCIPATAILAGDTLIPVALVRRLAIRGVDLIWYPFGLIAATMTILATQDQQLYAHYTQTAQNLSEQVARTNDSFERSLSACREKEKYPLLFREGGFVLGTKTARLSATEFCETIKKGDYSVVWANHVIHSVETNKWPIEHVDIDNETFRESLVDVCTTALGQHRNENGYYAPIEDDLTIIGFSNSNLTQLRPTVHELARVNKISIDLLEICRSVISIQNKKRDLDWYTNKFSERREPMHPWFWAQILALLAGFKFAKSIAEFVQTLRDDKRNSFSKQRVRGFATNPSHF